MKDQSAGVTQLGNWYAVAAVAAASLGLAAGAQEANATPVIVHPVPGPVTAPVTASHAGLIYFNMLDTTGTKYVAGGSSTPAPNSVNFELAGGRVSHGSAAIAVGRSHLGFVLTSSGGAAAKLGNGAAINSAAFGFGTLARSVTLLGEKVSGSVFGNWQPGDTGFVGLALFTSLSTVFFGWAEIQLGSNYDPTLIAWGYNTTPDATDFTAPEPSSLLLLASGAAGLAAYRRRRAQRRVGA